jgi:tetratricopeptide (TPR) repeat protein
VFVQSRLAVKLTRSEPLQAAAILEAFLAEKDIAREDLGWAKRNLAMIYAVGGTPEDRRRAMDLIKTADDFGSTPEEMRATAAVLTTLAKYLEGDDRRLILGRAAAALTSAHQVSNSQRDLFHLAQLFRAAGNRPESRRCLQSLLNVDPNNIYFLTAALEELTEDGNIAAAEAFAERLRKNFPGEFRAVAVVARFECKAGRPDRALAVAEGYARAADLSAGDYLARSGRVAELLDELSRLPKVRGTPAGRRMVDAAVERYAALVPSRAESVVAIAGLLGSDGRVADAFTRIDVYERYETKRIRALAGLAAVRSGGATERQFATVTGWLETCLKEEPNSATLRLNEAELLAIRHDIEGAAAVYEAVLKQDPRNVVALNNLAWLLATDANSAEKALGLIDRATREAGLSGEMLDTRARVRITLRQYDQAERDLNEALSREVTPLRHFHLAVLRLAQSPARTDDAAKSFQEAKARGLDVANIHPTDLPTYKVLDTGSK